MLKNTDFPFASKLTRLRYSLKSEGFDAVLLSKPANIYYYANFSGEDSWLLVTATGTFLLTDGRYTAQAAIECPDIPVLCQGGAGNSWLDLLVDTCKTQALTALAFEGGHLTYEQYELLNRELSAKMPEIRVKNCKDMADSIRAVKEEWEIYSLLKAAIIGDLAFADLEKFLKPGITEKELATELNYALFQEGAEGLAFSTIVAAGKNGAKPHAKPSNYQVQTGDLITLDFGAVYQGYCGDMTRTVCIGKPDTRQQELYSLVLQAQEYTLSKLKPGMTCGEADRLARTMIEAAGYGAYFSHSLGHGVGLEIHESPFLRKNSSAVLEIGQAVTIEPGIYIPDWGGIRIEDTVVMTIGGIRRLTLTSKELKVY